MKKWLTALLLLAALGLGSATFAADTTDLTGMTMDQLTTGGKYHFGDTEIDVTKNDDGTFTLTAPNLSDGTSVKYTLNQSNYEISVQATNVDGTPAPAFEYSYKTGMVTIPGHSPMSVAAAEKLDPSITKEITTIKTALGHS